MARANWRGWTRNEPRREKPSPKSPIDLGASPPSPIRSPHLSKGLRRMRTYAASLLPQRKKENHPVSRLRKAGGL